MQESSSNLNNDRTGTSQQRQFFVMNMQPMITTPPQNASEIQEPTPQSYSQNAQHTALRSYNNISVNLIQELHNFLSFFHQRYSDRYHPIWHWLGRTNQSEQTSRLNESENTVINPVNVHESTAQALSTEKNASRTIPEDTQMNFQNVSENTGERGPETNPTTFQENSNLAFNDNSSSGSRSEISNSIPTTESHLIDKLFSKYLPLIYFLTLKAIHDHTEGIIIFIGLLAAFIPANSVIKREIAKQNTKSFLSLGIIFFSLSACISFIYFIFRDQHLYNILVFIPPHVKPLTIWDLLWILGITDFVLKFIIMQLKIGVISLPAQILPYSNRGKWFLMLEQTSQLYRASIPIQPWLYFLMEYYHASDKVILMGFSAFYLFFKIPELIGRIQAFIKAFRNLLKDTKLGVRPTKDVLDAVGTQCPICRDDNKSLIMLSCRHVFCEACATTWFDREQTCPLCRAKVADDPMWKNGATSFFTYLF